MIRVSVYGTGDESTRRFRLINAETFAIMAEFVAPLADIRGLIHELEDWTDDWKGVDGD